MVLFNPTSFRNCLVGKCYHIKICDFGSDSPTYRKDYVETENLLLVPLRWMAWESAIEVNMFNIWSNSHNSFSDLRRGICVFHLFHTSTISITLMIVVDGLSLVSAPLHHKI